MHPSVPRPIRIVLVLATIASLLVFPALTTAAPKGSDLALFVTRQIDKVSAGQNGAFVVTIEYTGAATLTHATLTATITGAVSATVPAGCEPFPDVTCDLGTITSATAPLVLTFVTEAPPRPRNPAPMAPIEFSATLNVDAGNNNPSEDEFTESDIIAVEPSPTFFGAWAPGTGLAGVIGQIGGGGHQTAAINIPGFTEAYTVTATEFAGDVCGVAGIGNGVSMAIADGAVITPYITVTLTYDAEARGNRTPGNVQVIHDADCETPLVSGCSVPGCFQASWSGSGRNKLLVVQAFLPHNGIVKGF